MAEHDEALIETVARADFESRHQICEWERIGSWVADHWRDDARESLDAITAAGFEVAPAGTKEQLAKCRRLLREQVVLGRRHARTLTEGFLAERGITGVLDD